MASIAKNLPATNLLLVAKTCNVPSASGFFRHHGIWAPGVRLFRAIGFQAKALIIALSFLVPLALLSWNFFSSQTTQIEFSAKERLGISYAREVMPLLKLLQKQRMLSVEASVKGSAPPDLAALVVAIEARGAAFAAVQKQHGGSLGTDAAYAAWQAKSKALGNPIGAPSAQVFAAHSASIEALLDLLGTSTDGSNLTLDPDIDSYYLMDTALFRLPVMIEAAGKIRGWGVGILTAGQATQSQTRIIIEQLTVLTHNAASMSAGVQKAIIYNDSLRAKVQADAADAPVRGLAATMDKTLLSPDGVKGDPKAHAAAATASIEAMFALTESATNELDALIAKRVAALESTRQLLAVVTGLGILTSLYLFISFRKVLEGGLTEVARHIDAMRDGNLTTVPRAWGSDEAARLMDSLAEMQTALRRIVSQVRLASDQLVTSSSEISSGAADLSGRTEQSAANLEETAAAMEQIAATVKSNTETLEKTTQLAASNADATAACGNTIAEVAVTMQNIHGSSARISDIIGTIDGIAFQTNILALNAAVEAARAGEQGRGFAVVASEVRALAKRTSAAAHEIKTLITASVGQVKSGVSITQKAGENMRDVVVSTQSVRELLSQVASGAREQSLGIKQAAMAVQELDTVTQQNAALVEETAAAAALVKEQARGLANEVSQFRLPA